MRIVLKKVAGTLFEQDGRAVLWLHDDGQPLFLCFALIIRGSEQPLLPALLLDDWGNEIRGVKLYRWTRDNGELYPRAELFGYDQGGVQQQRFLRELELYFKYPTFAYHQKDAPPAGGVLIDAIVIDGETQLRIKPPVDVETPLRHAAAGWWQLPPQRRADFSPAALDVA